MKKILIPFLLFLIISLTGCNKNITPVVTDNSSVEPSSELTSSANISEPSSQETSSITVSSKDESTSSKETSSKATSSKQTSSKTPSSKETSSKAPSPKPPISSITESKPASSSSEAEAPIIPIDDTLFNTTSIEQIILKLVNEEREGLGRSKLVWNQSLFKSAKIRSDEMAAQNSGLDISHTRPNGDNWNSTLKEVGYSDYYAYANENIAAVKNGIVTEIFVDNNKLAEMIFSGWKNSPSHYEAIIRPQTIEIGIAVSRNQSDVYATQHFGQIE